MIENITLNEAIEALKQGKKVSRKNWPNTDYYQKIGAHIYSNTIAGFEKVGSLDEFYNWSNTSRKEWRVLNELENLINNPMSEKSAWYIIENLKLISKQLEELVNTNKKTK